MSPEAKAEKHRARCRAYGRANAKVLAAKRHAKLLKNPEKYRAQSLVRYWADPEKKRAQNRANYQRHAKKRNARYAMLRRTDPKWREKANGYVRNYYYTHREEILAALAAKRRAR